MAKLATNVSGAMLLPSLIQVTESISGSVVPLAMFCSSPTFFNCYYFSSFGVFNFLNSFEKVISADFYFELVSGE